MQLFTNYSAPKSQLGWLNLPHTPTLLPPVTAKQRVVKIYRSAIKRDRWLWRLESGKRYEECQQPIDIAYSRLGLSLTFYGLPERDFVTFAGSLLSQIRLSSVTFVRPTQGVGTFGNISSPFCTLALSHLWHPCNLLRDRPPQGNPCVWGVKRKRATYVTFGYLCGIAELLVEGSIEIRFGIMLTVCNL